MMSTVDTIESWCRLSTPKTASSSFRRRRHGPQPAPRRRRHFSEPRFRAVADDRLLEADELLVRDRRQQQGEEEAERLAANDRHGDRRAAGAA